MPSYQNKDTCIYMLFSSLICLILVNYDISIYMRKNSASVLNCYRLGIQNRTASEPLAIERTEGVLGWEIPNRVPPVSVRILASILH